MISSHPEVEARALAELGALGLLPTPEHPQPRAMTYDDLSRLVYTSNAIRVSAGVLPVLSHCGAHLSVLWCRMQECMRMLPVLADGTNRTTTRDTRLGPHLIPKGTMVWVPLKATFCSPHNWDRPDEFLPVSELLRLQMS